MSRVKSLVSDLRSDEKKILKRIKSIEEELDEIREGLVEDVLDIARSIKSHEDSYFSAPNAKTLLIGVTAKINLALEDCNEVEKELTEEKYKDIVNDVQYLKKQLTEFNNSLDLFQSKKRALDYIEKVAKWFEARSGKDIAREKEEMERREAA